LWIEMALIAALILLNGLLAMSELAVVSSRKARLQAMARAKRSGARRALQLAEEPGRFLSTVQIGITLVGGLAGALSGATIAARFSLWVESAFGLAEAASDTIAFAIVVGGVTYLSLIVGELVPKQIALKNPERIAVTVAPAMTWLAKIAGPLVTLLDLSSRFVLRIIGAGKGNAEKVSEEEIRQLVAEAESAGIVEPAEGKMSAAVMKLGDRSVRAVMTPRRELDWLDLDAPLDEQLKRIRDSMHLRLPAANGNIDEPVGAISVKAVLNAQLDAQKTGTPITTLVPLLRPVPAVHESADVLDVLA